MPHARLPTYRRARRPSDYLLRAPHERWGIHYHDLTPPVVWIEHHPPETTDGSTETLDLVAFSSYEVKERAPYLGETRLSLGEATWKRITRGMVEVLVGGEV